MSSNTDIHVIPHAGSWIVKQEASDHASSIYETKAEAVAEARRLALRDNVVLVTHDAEGRAGELLEVDINGLPSKFAELMSSAGPQTEITITDNGVPLAKLVPLGGAQSTENKPRILGLHPGSVTWLADDFDAPLL